MVTKFYQFSLHALFEDSPDIAPYVGDHTKRPTPLDLAVMASLLTWRRADGDEGPEQGWWADTFDRRPLGSRLWLLVRARVTVETVEAGKATIFFATGRKVLVHDKNNAPAGGGLAKPKPFDHANPPAGGKPVSES